MIDYNYIVQKDFITFIINGESKTVVKSHPNFNKVKKAIFEENYRKVISLLDIGTSIFNYSQGLIEIKQGVVYYKNFVVNNVVCERILDFMAEGREDFKPLVSFLERLMENPSKHSLEQLYKFLEHKNIPIDSEGYVLAYKGVSDNYFDVYTGTFDNHPGNTHEMPRNQVADDPEEACSYGFHVGALEYAQGYGSRIVIVKVDPKDVVSVPKDFCCQKMRVCKYSVIKDYDGPLPSSYYDEKEEDEFEDYYEEEKDECFTEPIKDSEEKEEQSKIRLYY